MKASISENHQAYMARRGVTKANGWRGEHWREGKQTSA